MLLFLAITLSKAQQYATQFINEDEVGKGFMLTSDDINGSEKIAEDIGYIHVDNILSTETMLKMAQNATAEYVLFYMKTSPITLGYHALTRLVHVATDTKAALTYANRYSVEAGKVVRHPVIDYQQVAFATISILVRWFSLMQRCFVNMLNKQKRLAISLLVGTICACI